MGTLYAQPPKIFGDRLMVGTPMTYRGGRQMDIPNRYHELTWSKNIAVNLTPHLYLGLDIPLNRYLSLDLAFIFHDTYGTWRETGGYNIYIIGLNVNLVCVELKGRENVKIEGSG